MAIALDEIVPWGRSYREYELMFELGSSDLADGVLDCGGGPASFTAEAASRGIRAVAVDPIYAFPSDAIRERFEAILPRMLAQVRATPDDWTWTFHRDPDDLAANRRAALERFLGDFDAGLLAKRYIAGRLPSLPTPSGSFGLALCSHLLFLYSDLLTTDFHVQSIVELCRIAREVRIFPLLTLDGQPSPHIDRVRSALEAKELRTEIVCVPYELQRGGTEMMRVYSTGTRDCAGRRWL